MPVVTRNRAFRFGLATGLVLLWPACRAPQVPGPAVSPAEWQIQLGQAVWHPPAPAPAIAGECVLGIHPAGDLLIDFSKGSLPVIAVRCALEAWQLEIPAEGRSIVRRGMPPARSAWLVLARHLRGAPPPRGWEVYQDTPEHVRIRQPRTGEQLELYLDPAQP